MKFYIFLSIFERVLIREYEICIWVSFFYLERIIWTSINQMNFVVRKIEGEKDKQTVYSDKSIVMMHLKFNKKVRKLTALPWFLSFSYSKWLLVSNYQIDLYICTFQSLFAFKHNYIFFYKYIHVFRHARDRKLFH